MSRSPFLKAAVGLVAGALATGCAKNSGSSQSLDLNAVIQSNQPAAVKSESLAKASEALLSAQGFAYASDIADLSLQLDPSNLRAQFVKAVLAPIMPNKGILSRVAPLTEKNKKFKEQYDKTIAQLDTDVPNSTVRTFLFDGPQDIKTETDLQAHTDEVVAGFDHLRRFAKANKDKSLTVLTTDAFYSTMLKRSSAACIVVNPTPYTYEIDCPSKQSALEMVFERADFEAIQQGAAGLQLYTALLNSYDLSGALQVADAHPPEGPEPKREQVINELLANPKFGQLRMRNGFRLVSELGPDVVSGLRWVLQNQTSLCPIGTPSPRNRVGRMLDSGVCMTAKQKENMAESLRDAETALAGKVLTVKGEDGQKGLQIVPMALVYTPVGDLHSLTPLKFNACDEVVEMQNPKLNGFFVNTDLNEIFKGQKTCGN